MRNLCFVPIKLLVYFVVIASLSAFFWVERNFSIPSIDQLLYHIVHARQMPLTADRDLVRSFTVGVVLLPLLAAVSLTWLDSAFSRKIAAALAAGGWITRIAWAGRVPALLIGTGTFLMSETSAFSYIADQRNGTDYFGAHYVAPKAVTIGGGEPKNLVIIYLESVEATYGDAALFGRDLLRPLAELPGESFADFQQVPGTGWTMGGIVGSQCGIPLKNVFLSARDWRGKGISYGINEIGERLARFLPGAACLSDILQQYGYTNVFVGGASLDFAGKGTFLRNHAYDQVYGREELLEAGLEPTLNASGFYDDAVLTFAKVKFQELHASGRPFNLTLLTLDTHGPEGFFSPTCAARGASSFADIVECTAVQVSEFVRFIIDNGYLADTRIVILGDHLAMRNPLSDALEQVPQRTVFNRFIGDPASVKNRETIVHFDLLPTILDFIGLRVEGGQLGLGYTGFGPLPRPTPTDRLAQLRTELPRRSKAYLALWHSDHAAVAASVLAAP